MIPLALRSLFHNRVRAAATITGVTFAVVLVATQFAVFDGVQASASNIIDHSGADFWITARGVPNLLAGVPLSERKLFQVLSTSGVTGAEKYIIECASWRKTDGVDVDIQIIGFNPGSGLGGPWSLVEGDVARLKEPDTVIIDRLYQAKLGITHVGQSCEIHGHRARVIGFTAGIRTFTTAAPVFTSFKNAHSYTSMLRSKTTFVLVKSTRRDTAALKRELNVRLPDVDVLTGGEFSARTRRYWIFRTGAGAVVLGAAILGLLVGTIVVSQTIYAATLDYLTEYATLKAIGARNGYLCRVLLTQASATALAGYAIGMVIVWGVVYCNRDGPIGLILSPTLAGVVFALTLIMCCIASLVAIRTVINLEPGLGCRR